jgi:class 3 adenylate cyclase
MFFVTACLCAKKGKAARWEVTVSGHKKELGVTAFGHRRKLLDAIAALPSDTSAVESPAKIRRVSAESRAERRQVTVMFSELVGSTALSARMDPEDFGEIVSAYHKSIATTVQSLGGFVANYMGDGVVSEVGRAIETCCAN